MRSSSAGVHVAAALYHHVVLKDGVLRAMLPAQGWARRQERGAAREER